MSLQLLAKQMEAKGRKGDSMLVHMTAKEVAALQKMAESAGGSLSVNPETGLVEANFLKRLLPTLVGAGLMATGVGMPLAIAGGALTGGIQAKRDDKDFLTGALMGGLGAYGGAGLAGGLTSAGAGAMQQGAMATAPQGAAAQGLAAAEASKQFVAQPALTQMGQGFSALGKEGGRDLFMQSVGGAGGLAKAAGAAASPMMMEDRKQAEIPVDDEMFSYTFDPGRTNIERTPSGSSAERQYFNSSFSPMRRIRARDYPVYAAQGGLMSLAEGGEAVATSAETTPAEVNSPTASELALAYLMGERSSSSAGLPAMAAQAQASQAPVVGSDNMYAFDPATGSFLRNPGVPGASFSGSPVGTSFSGDANLPLSQRTIDFLDNETPAERDARMEKVSDLIGFAMPGGLFSKGVSSFFGDAARDERGRAFDSGGSDSGGGSDDFGGFNGMAGDPSGMGAAGGTAFAAQGGLMQLAKGGMASGGFVVPADVVSALGNGSTDAGLRKLSAMMGDVKPIKGKGDGLSDSIPTNIDGKQPARVADGEAYIDPKTVKRLGGAKKLYALMDKVREQAHGKTTQQRKVNPARVMA